VPTSRGATVIHASEIDWIEAAGNYVQVWIGKEVTFTASRCKLWKGGWEKTVSFEPIAARWSALMGYVSYDEHKREHWWLCFRAVRRFQYRVEEVQRSRRR
jgi:hypothetical protein